MLRDAFKLCTSLLVWRNSSLSLFLQTGVHVYEFVLVYMLTNMHVLLYYVFWGFFCVKLLSYKYVNLLFVCPCELYAGAHWNYWYFELVLVSCFVAVMNITLLHQIVFIFLCIYSLRGSSLPDSLSVFPVTPVSCLNLSLLSFFFSSSTS